MEAVSVGVCAALKPDDVVYTHHRSHLAYLAKGGSFYALAAELYGKQSGCSNGKGGSVHLTARNKNFIISSAILGQTIAVATGSALAFKMNHEERVAVTFFGEAACEEGVFYESLNFAAIHKLPVLYVCENNGFSTETPLHKRKADNSNLCDRAKSFGIVPIHIDGNEIEAVLTFATMAREMALNGSPVFIECMTYRWLEHVGPNFDHELGRTYRDESELRAWQKKCPIKRNAQAIMSQGLATQAELEKLDHDIMAELEADANCARVSPDAHGLMEHVY